MSALIQLAGLKEDVMLNERRTALELYITPWRSTLLNATRVLNPLPALENAKLVLFVHAALVRSRRLRRASQVSALPYLSDVGSQESADRTMLLPS